MTAPTDHPDELLTALVDGQLTVDEQDQVQAHLAGCERCARALRAEQAVAGLLRGLPVVEPAAGFYSRVLLAGPTPRRRARRHARFAAANLAAAAAVWVGVVGVARLTGSQTVRPPLADLVSAHASALPAVGLATPTTAASPATGAVADVLSRSYRLVETLVVGGRRQAVYADGKGRVLSMFLQPGRLDEASLPDDAEAVAVGGLPAWRITMGDDHVVLLQRPGVVVVLVGPATTDDERMVAEASGRAPEPSVTARIDAAARGLLDSFGLG